MRRTIALGAGALVVLLASCQDTSQPLAPSETGETMAAEPAFSLQAPGERVMPGRILARLSEGADPSTVGNTHGVAFQRMAAGGGFAVFKGAVGNERALAARLKGDDRVVWAEPDYLRQPTAIDPKLWAFYNPGGLSISITRGRDKGVVTSYLSLDDADEDNIENYASGGGSVSIASIDTGVEFTHPEFGQATLVPGRDFYDNDADPSDTNDHGTHTTGTMVGDNVGVAGVAGAAGAVTVYVYRVCGPLGCPTSAIVEAITAAAAQNVVAMNLSLGGGSLSDAEADAIAAATAAGSLVIASAGNDGTGTVSCPACDPNAISVAASNWQDELSYYSNWGLGLDITAPGGELYSNTTSEAGIWSSVRGGYAYFQGTSMAAPQVTGAAAVVASITGKVGADLRAALEGSTDDLGTGGYDEEFGHGRLNVYRAVTGTTLEEGTPPPPPPPPADLTAAFKKSCSGLTCAFDGSGSIGEIIAWDWIYGDGEGGSGVTTSHAFPGAGTFTVTLTVSDGANTDSTAQDVVCTLRGKTVRCK